MNVLVVLYLVVSSVIAMYETATIPGPFHLAIGMVNFILILIKIFPFNFLDAFFQCHFLPSGPVVATCACSLAFLGLL
jgi:hypothetical protein